MKTTSILNVAIATLFNINCFAQSMPVDSMYLAQTPSVNTPKIFTLSISSGFFAAERVAISSDSTEIYYSELNGYDVNSKSRIKYYTYSGGKWNGPEILFENFFSPALSVDGKKMFIQKITGSSQEVWCSEKTDIGWDIPYKYMPGRAIDYMLWETNNGNLYFGSRSANEGLGQLDWSELIINGNDTTVQSLGTPLCTSGDDVDFGISRNDSIIIIAARTSTNRKANGILDLFISYKKNDGTWTNPKNLGADINVNNSNDGRWAPCFTADNKYLFYSGGWYAPKVYVVRIDNLVDSLRNTNFSPYVTATIPKQTDTVGQSFIYTIPDNTFFDDDGNNTLTYSATLSNNNPLPTWLSFNPATMTFSGTPTESGTITIKVIATDNAMEFVAPTFTLKISGSTTKVNQAFEQSIQVYPNPTKGIVNISFGERLNKNTAIEITNIEGKQIYTNTFQNSSTATIDLSGNPKGIYIISVTIDGEIIRKKIIIE